LIAEKFKKIKRERERERERSRGEKDEKYSFTAPENEQAI